MAVVVSVGSGVAACSGVVELQAVSKEQAAKAARNLADTANGSLVIFLRRIQLALPP